MKNLTPMMDHAMKLGGKYVETGRSGSLIRVYVDGWPLLLVPDFEVHYKSTAGRGRRLHGGKLGGQWFDAFTAESLMATEAYVDSQGFQRYQISGIPTDLEERLIKEAQLTLTGAYEIVGPIPPKGA